MLHPVSRYSYETTSLEELAELLREQEAGGRVGAVAFLLNGSETELFLCEEGAKKITLATLVSDQLLRDVFTAVGQRLLVAEGGRLDFLGSYAADHIDGGLLARSALPLFLVLPPAISLAPGS